MQLKGITWNHPRGLNPLVAASRELTRTHPDIHISWDVRSLTDFGEQPLELLIETYDLLLFDHPFVGTAAHNRHFVALEEAIDSVFLGELEASSVGPSFTSYRFAGHLWALPVDATSQLSAYREDVLEAHGADVPTRWEDVFQLARKLSPAAKVALPLVPTDVIGCFWSLYANVSGQARYDDERGLNLTHAEFALDTLLRLSRVVDERSFVMNPIQMLDSMTRHDDIAYVPLIFGYSNYARSDRFTRPIRYTNVPSVGDRPHGALLGGVGIGVSNRSANVPAALEFLRFVTGAEVQRGLYVANDGQPAHRLAWLDEANNRLCNGFFRATLETLERAYLRPRYNGYPDRQRRAGVLIHELLRAQGSPIETARTLKDLLEEPKGPSE